MRPGIISSRVLQGSKTRFFWLLLWLLVLLKLQNCEGRIISSWSTSGWWKNVSMLLWAGRSWGERRHVSGLVQAAGRLITLPQPFTWTETFKLSRKNIKNMSKMKSTSMWQHYVVWPLQEAQRSNYPLYLVKKLPGTMSIYFCPRSNHNQLMLCSFIPDHHRKTGLLLLRKAVFWETR